MKILNQYARVLHHDGLYEKIPKAVLAAIAVSLASQGDPWNPGLSETRRFIVQEWQALHDNGIVPQAPPKFEEVGA